MNFLQKIVNAIPVPVFNPFQSKGGKPTDALVRSGGGSDNPKHNTNNLIFPSAPDRTAKDLEAWRDSLRQTENPFFPYRTQMQMLFNDTILNDHVRSCMLRRRNMTMLRDFEVQTADGKNIPKWTEYFHKPWFSQKVLQFILDARFYGYSLIALGDIKKGEFVNPSIVRRTHISPERLEVMPFLNNPTGYKFDEAPYKDWHLWVPTVSEDGVTSCGMGLLYPVARLEIFLRSNTSWNADFVQIFGMPILEMKTNKTEEAERKMALEAIQSLASNGCLVSDAMGDELVVHATASQGNGYKSYNDFDKRLIGGVSKLILGHEDAISSVPGKLGASQLVNSGSKTNDGDAATPVAKAMRDIQTEDANFIEPVVTYALFEQMRNLGIRVPQGAKFVFLNDAEEREIQALEADKNQKIATLALTMAQGGLKMDEAYFEKMTGVGCTAIEIQPDNNVTKGVKDQAAGKGALKDEGKKRKDKPKHT